MNDEFETALTRAYPAAENRSVRITCLARDTGRTKTHLYRWAGGEKTLPTYARTILRQHKKIVALKKKIKELEK